MTNLGLPKRFHRVLLLSLLVFILPFSMASGRSPSLQTALTIVIDNPIYSTYATSGFFTVSVNTPVLADTFFNFTVTDGTASSGVDYFVPNTIFAITAGQKTGTIPFDILGGAQTHSSINFTVTVFNPSAPTQVTGTATLTDKPVNLTALALSFDRIQLTWVNNNPNLTENLIERSPDGLTNWQAIDSAGGTATQYTSSALACGTTYYYRLRGTINSGAYYTDYSNITSAKTDACSPLDAVPMLNFFTTDTPTLTWNPVSGAASYDIQIADNRAFTGALLVRDLHGLSYTPAALDKGVYCWEVRAVVSGKAGSWSAIQTFVVDVR